MESSSPYKQRVAAIFDTWCKVPRAATPGARHQYHTQKSHPYLVRKICWRALPICRYLMPYDVYQRLMDYWDEVMQDDVYLIAANGWQAGRILRSANYTETPEFTIKKGQKTFKYVGELVPASLVIARFFGTCKQETGATRERKSLNRRNARLNSKKNMPPTDSALTGLEGKNGITKNNVHQRAMDLKEAIQKTYPEETIEHSQAKLINKDDVWQFSLDQEYQRRIWPIRGT